MKRLHASRVAVFGLGGVGGTAAEALARSGVGALDLIDSDTVCMTNLNRQIFATRETIGMRKVDAAEARIHAIDPEICVTKHAVFYLPESRSGIDLRDYDYVVDAVDTVTAKLDLIEQAQAAGTPVISAMGCGNRVDPSRLRISVIEKTEMDPLAKVMRRELKKRRIRNVKVVFSTEEPIRPLQEEGSRCVLADCCPEETRIRCGEKYSSPGSTSFVPPAAGLLIASAVVRDLTGFDPAERTKSGRQMKEESAEKAENEE